MRGRGRPRIEIDYKEVENLASIMCTEEEIASFLGCSVDTLQRNEKFKEIYLKGLDKAKISLRRKQFKLAGNNPTMGIWLGKQYLGQKDKTEIEHSGNINNPFEQLTTEELRQLIKNGK